MAIIIVASVDTRLSTDLILRVMSNKSPGRFRAIKRSRELQPVQPVYGGCEVRMRRWAGWALIWAEPLQQSEATAKRNHVQVKSGIVSAQPCVGGVLKAITQR